MEGADGCRKEISILRGDTMDGLGQMCNIAYAIIILFIFFLIIELYKKLKEFKNLF